MSGPTPGPWQFIPALERSVYAGSDVAPQLVGRTDVIGISQEEASANARLMALAPEMLLELRSLADRYRKVLIEARYSEMFADQAISGVKALIAKAEGRS